MTDASPSVLLYPRSRQAPRQASTRRDSFLEQIQQQLDEYIPPTLDEQERKREIRQLRSILVKIPEAREPQDIDTLYNYVLQNALNTNIFKGAQEIVCKTICREMTLLELPTDGIVCRQGDFGDTFFIIIEGSVSLFINSKGERLRIHRRNSANTLAGETDRQRRDSRVEEIPEDFGTFLKHIGVGGTFGEVAILDPTAKRSCTIKCDVPTSFICLKRGSYQRLIRVNNSDQLDFTPVELLETFFFLDKWPHGELSRLSNRLRSAEFPAGSYLARVGAEANCLFFIFGGVVQESVPIIQHVNANGKVVKCTAVEESLSRQSERVTIPGTVRRSRIEIPKRKIAVETNLYQDHDVCNELPIITGKVASTVDLFAITDVKVLVMDRETYRDYFSLQGIAFIKETLQKLRWIKNTRDSWRQTRMAMALAHPGLVITLSTKDMMIDAKCICGWCGSQEHLTGDIECAALITLQQKQADKAQKKKKLFQSKRSPALRARIMAVKNTLRLAQKDHVDLVNDETPLLTTTHDERFAVAERNRLSTIVISESDRKRLSSISNASFVADNFKPKPSISSSRRVEGDRIPVTELPPLHHNNGEDCTYTTTELLSPECHNDIGCVDTSALSIIKTLREGIAEECGGDTDTEASNVKIDRIRRGNFTENLQTLYYSGLTKEIKPLSTMKQIQIAKEELLEKLAMPSNQTVNIQAVEAPRKPHIPKRGRRWVGGHNGTVRHPRPDRFMRKINRRLRRIKLQDQPVVVVEESLQDMHPKK